MRSTSQPLSGSIRASASKYPLVTHWIACRLLCSSTARLPSETLTTVASSCARNEPSTATETVFHTPGLSRSKWSASSGKSFQHLIDRPHSCKTREDVLERKPMLVGIPARAGVFGDNESKGQARPLSQCRFDPHVGRDSSEDDGVDVASPQLLLKRRSSEPAPVIFRDQKIPILKPGRGRNLHQFTG